MKMFLVYAALATATLTGPLAAAEFRADNGNSERGKLSMAEDRVQRKLTTILAADAGGYCTHANMAGNCIQRG